MLRPILSGLKLLRTPRCMNSEKLSTKHLCTAASQETDGVQVPTSKTSFTRRELHQAALGQASNTKHRALQTLGGSLWLGGFGVLAWNNWTTQIDWNYLGAGLIVLGAAVARSARAGTSTSAKKVDSRFKLKLLNSDARWKADDEALQKLLGSEEWPALAELNKAVAAEKNKAKTELLSSLQNEVSAVKIALLAGETAQMIQARLKPKTLVFDFETGGQRDMASPGGMKQKLKELTEIVTFVIHSSSKFDEVILRLHSPGGSVTDYGFASSQLLRIRQHGLKLTICIDKVAASGGYMMACTASEVVAAPFSFVGSIGVIAQLPNVHKLLQRNDIDFLQFTAGRWKRTVDPFTLPSEEGRQKMQEDISHIHEAFKGHVAEQRGSRLQIDEVATGEVFLGFEAKERGLVDHISTSDEVIAARMRVSDVVEISIAEKKKGFRDLLEGRFNAAESFIGSVWSRIFRSSRASVVLESQDPKIQ